MDRNSKRKILRMESFEERRIQRKKMKCTKILESLSIYMTFTVLGLSVGILGPTLVHMEFMYKTNTQKMSIAMMALNIGILLGSGICSLIFDRINRRLSFAIVNLLMGLSLGVAPHIPNLYGFHACIGLMATAHGFLISAGSPYLMDLWKNNKFQAPILQGAHAIWSVGAFICPFLTIPFLVDIPTSFLQHQFSTTSLYQNNGTVIGITPLYYNGTDVYHVYDIENDRNATKEDEHVVHELDGIERVKWAYLTVGLIIIGVSIMCFLMFITNKPSLRNERVVNKKMVKEKKPNQRARTCRIDIWKVVVLFMVFLFCFCTFWYDFVPGAFLASFVIRGLLWPVKHGAHITSLFYGFHGLGKILGIPVSYLLTPSQMLFSTLSVALLAFIFMSISAVYFPMCVWIAAALAGLSVSTSFPTIILWTGSRIKMTGALGGMFVVAASSGGLFGAGLAGSLFEIDHMSMAYIAISATVCNIVLFVILNIVTFCFESSASDMDENQQQELSEIEHLKERK